LIKKEKIIDIHVLMNFESVSVLECQC